MDSPEYIRGLEIAEQLHGAHSGAELIATLREICPAYLSMTMEWAYAGIAGRGVLPIQTRVLMLLACCICRAELPGQVKAYTEAALGLGIPQSEVIETILQTLPIAGFPAVTNAFIAVKDVLQPTVRVGQFSPLPEPAS
jgi:4-carboxymuconolactone decarboxylase